jgi:hypothetical protein
MSCKVTTKERMMKKGEGKKAAREIGVRMAKIAFGTNDDYFDDFSLKRSMSKKFIGMVKQVFIEEYNRLEDDSPLMTERKAYRMGVSHAYSIQDYPLDERDEAIDSIVDNAMMTIIEYGGTYEMSLAAMYGVMDKIEELTDSN